MLLLQRHDFAPEAGASTGRWVRLLLAPPRDPDWPLPAGSSILVSSGASPPPRAWGFLLFFSSVHFKCFASYFFLTFCLSCFLCWAECYWDDSCFLITALHLLCEPSGSPLGVCFSPARLNCASWTLNLLVGCFRAHGCARGRECHWNPGFSANRLTYKTERDP